MFKKNQVVRLIIAIPVAGAVVGGMIHFLVTVVPSPYNYILGGTWIVLASIGKKEI